MILQFGGFVNKNFGMLIFNRICGRMIVSLAEGGMSMEQPANVLEYKCPCCSNPTILPGRVSGGLKPG